ncbi:uncharacterized protein MELLADRAFT_69921 [Melampsora larici-populina 98AG31]|uniref:Ubiquitin-like domain-containing protein n=1 Tax=Melampsora larici-populina (strain 98AG31 / pathotype 3-4-7) TaxID=747676 RepID=F4SCT7_MELLP|nr:uncharacterized protein MELLADRAFT_69921 [Melampsora larici-populina 98AG31]EGF97541.1 hypothetical protein MELLADRAFT_69921 [Melampsora larici-populina 98AG31]
MAPDPISNNIVFKYGDRMILTEAPRSLHAAQRDVRELFKLETTDVIEFFLRVPDHGLAELSKSSWRNLQYGSVIEMTTTLHEKHGSLSLPDNALMRSDFETHSNRSSWTDKTAVDPIEPHDSELEHPEQTSGADFFEVLTDPMTSVQVELPSEKGLVETLEVKLRRSQGFQVLFGDLSYKLCVPTEHLQLWLNRGRKLKRISPTKSVEDLGIIDGDKIRVRIRIISTPKISSPKSSEFPITWTEGFLKPTFAFPMLNGSCLPKSPAFGRSERICNRSPALSPK